MHWKTPEDVGANMAEFALVSLATMAERNPNIKVPGLVPYLGAKLTVDWISIGVLCGVIAGLHLVLLALAFYLTLGIPIPSESSLAMGKLWQPLLEKASSSKTDLRPDTLVIYGPVNDNETWTLHEVTKTTAFEL